MQAQGVAGTDDSLHSFGQWSRQTIEAAMLNPLDDQTQIIIGMC